VGSLRREKKMRKGKGKGERKKRNSRKRIVRRKQCLLQIIEIDHINVIIGKM